jgi:alpha-beta hydrolase superfamily lysophospholipase
MKSVKPIRWDRRRVRRNVFVSLGLLPVGYCGFTALIAYTFLHPARMAIRETPEADGLKYESISFRSDTDNLKINGWLIPAEGKPRGVIVLCHGRQGTRGSMRSYLPWLHRAGYTLLTFDFRASGESEGDTSTIGMNEVRDALGAIQYVKSRPELRGLPLGIFGHSMGGAVAIQAAAKSPEVRAVVADSPFASLDRAVSYRFRSVFGSSAPLVSEPVRFFGERMGGFDTTTVSPLAAVGKIAPRPLFLIHGTKDNVTSMEDSKMLYEAAGGPKDLWLVEGAWHVGAQTVAKQEYERRVLSFFRAGMR